MLLNQGFLIGFGAAIGRFGVDDRAQMRLEFGELFAMAGIPGEIAGFTGIGSYVEQLRRIV